MATFIADSALDMRLLDVLGLFDYDNLEFSSTLIRPFDDAANFVKFTGTGFAANPFTGAITGGTLTGIEFVDLGAPILRVTGASMPAADFYTFASTGDANGALSGLFVGNDIFTGSTGADVLLSFAGNDTLTGGAGLDTLIGGAGNDVYVVTAGDTVTELLGEGIDTVRSATGWILKANLENLTLLGTANTLGTGNALANSLVGNSGNNTLKGLGAKDTLTGNAGNDVLDGGTANDTLIGGAGSDTFVFSTALAANRDTVQDFAPGVDKLRLDDDIFTALTPGVLSADAFASGRGLVAAQDETDRIIYNTTTGGLYYDADGAGGTAAVQFAVLAGTPHPGLSATDILIVT